MTVNLSERSGSTFAVLGLSPYTRAEGLLRWRPPPGEPTQPPALCPRVQEMRVRRARRGGGERGARGLTCLCPCLPDVQARWRPWSWLSLRRALVHLVKNYRVMPLTPSSTLARLARIGVPLLVHLPAEAWFSS